MSTYNAIIIISFKTYVVASYDPPGNFNSPDQYVANVLPPKNRDSPKNGAASPRWVE